MTPEQKQRAMQMLRRFSQANPRTLHADNAAVDMAALLQELIDAPEPVPFGYFKSEPFGWTDCAETDDGAIALYTAPPVPIVPGDVARDAALYCAVQRACAELPEGWEIRIELERSAGIVILVNPDGEDVDYSYDHEYMASDINDAIDAALLLPDNPWREAMIELASQLLLRRA